MFEDYERRDEVPGSKLFLELEAITQVSSWMTETVFIAHETDYVSDTEKMLELGVGIRIVDGVYPEFSGPDLRRVIKAFNARTWDDRPIVAVHEGIVMIERNLMPVSDFCERMREDLRWRSLTDEERNAETRARFGRAAAAATALETYPIPDFMHPSWVAELGKSVDSILGFADNG